MLLICLQYPLDDAECCSLSAAPPLVGEPRPQLPQDHWGRGRAAGGVSLAGARTLHFAFLTKARESLKVLVFPHQASAHISLKIPNQ
jgi:hypothetical protein